MLGLSLEKLLIVGMVAAFLLGPQQLPVYAQKLGQLVRSLKSAAASARVRAEGEAGAVMDSQQWQALDLRQYDPRRIIRQALDSQQEDGEPAVAPSPVYVIGGSSGHPRRIPLRQDEQEVTSAPQRRIIAPASERRLGSPRPAGLAAEPVGSAAAARKPDEEAGGAGSAADTDLPAVGADDRLHDGQSQAAGSSGLAA